MNTLSDEILVAYADDELPPAKRAAVERRLAHDAEARDRLAAFTSTGQWLARAYDDTLRATPPDALVRAIREEAARPRAAAAEGRPLSPRRSFWQRLRAPGWSLAGPAFGGAGVGLAAGIALMLALPGGEPAGLGEAALIDAALETAASGEPLVAEVGGQRLEITPIGTVRTADGAFCREFTEIRETGRAAPMVTHGLACRTDDPTTGPGWRTVARIDLSPAGTEGTGFALASGNEQQLFEALMATLATPQVLTPEEERERLGEGWR